MSSREKSFAFDAPTGGNETKLGLTHFGGTGLQVSSLGFGAMELAGPPRAPDISTDDIVRLVRSAFDLGINYFDTSIDYGQSEERLGLALNGIRDQVIVASKCGCFVNESSGERSHEFTGRNIRAGIEQSLRRLKTDFIDVMQLHGHPSRQELDNTDTFETLLDLQQKGLIGHIGISSRKPYISDFLDLDFIEVYQLPYSAIQRQHEDVANVLSSAGKAVVGRGTVARGSAVKGWSAIPIGMQAGKAKDIWEVAGLDDLLGGMSRIEFMVRFALTSRSIDICLTGTSNREHLEQNVRAASLGPLSDEIYSSALERLREAGSFPGEVQYERGGPKPPITS